MVNSNDKYLGELTPTSMGREDFFNDLEEIINEGNFHSDEVSETDIERALSEKRLKIRPKSKTADGAIDDNHVLQVVDKPWRSRRVSN